MALLIHQLNHRLAGKIQNLHTHKSSAIAYEGTRRKSFLRKLAVAIGGNFSFAVKKKDWNGVALFL